MGGVVLSELSGDSIWDVMSVRPMGDRVIPVCFLLDFALMIVRCMLHPRIDSSVEEVTQEGGAMQSLGP